MSENKLQFKHFPHGTNSPPLEATGEDKPMGASCIAGTQQAGHVLDAEQRREYFPGLHKEESGKEKKIIATQSKKVGQSLADQIDKKT